MSKSSNQQAGTKGQQPSADGSKLEVRTTADGSSTLYVPALDEQYHSRNGAWQESEHVFIAAGLRPLLAAGLGHYNRPPLHVLEVGLGTGLNALLTLKAVTNAEQGAIICYDALETLPLPAAIVEALAQDWAADPDMLHYFRKLHALPWNVVQDLGVEFSLLKRQEPAQTAQLPAAHYDLIYFDAFAPEKQPRLWTATMFERLYAAAAPGAVLVSYCAQGQFRRNLSAAGWRTEKLPGPLGKREMTRAVKAMGA